MKKLVSVLIMLFMLMTCLPMAAFAYETKYGVCTADVLNVRAHAGTEYTRVGILYEGESVTITNEKTSSDGTKWYYVTYQGGAGYVSSAYISLTTQTAPAQDNDFESYMNTQGFPESYKPYLRELHDKHPNWIFTAQQIGLDWDTVLGHELVIGRNLVHTSSLDSWKSMEEGAYNFDTNTWYGLDSSSWVAASQQVIEYYLDPRNFINDTYIFMFENLSYNSSIQNINGVKAILNGTFMSANYTCPDTKETKSYAQTFMEAAEKSGVSPYHLASRCRNEQGVNGAPQSLGTVKGYENYFNFFDVQAYATATMTAAEMGCKYAKTTNAAYLLPWTNQYKSIVGGSIFLGTGYIIKGQDTLYLQKFDVVDGGNGLYYHQYMTCVYGQASEAISLKNAYSTEVLNSAMEFKIPVYNNMPSQPCNKPVSEGDNNNYLRSITVSGSQITPAFNKFTYSYSTTVPAEISSIIIHGNPLGAGTVTGAGRVSLNEGENLFNIVCTAPSGVQRTYQLTITRKKASSVLQQGDVNGDKYLTVVDALMILKYNAGKITLTADQLSRADMDKNGVTDVVDALTLLKKISQL